MSAVESTYQLQDVPEGEFKGEGSHFRIFDFSAWIDTQPISEPGPEPATVIRPRGVQVSLKVAGGLLDKIFHGTDTDTADITGNPLRLIGLDLFRTDDITKPFTWRLPSLESSRIPHGVQIHARNGPLWNPELGPGGVIKCFVVLHVLNTPLKSPVVTLQQVS